MNSRELPVRAALMLLSILGLLAALWAGLLRIGWSWPILNPSLPISHGPLMISGFFGSLISLERAAALRKPWTYLAPLFSAVGGLLLILGIPGLPGPLLITLGSLIQTGVFMYIIRLHFADFTVVMGIGSLCWLTGNALWLLGWPVFHIVMWWVGFLVVTIAGERLELSRVAPPPPASRVLFQIILGFFLAGLLWMMVSFPDGVRLASAGLVGLGLWLARYDIARRTVRRPGLTRFIAVCLLSGFAWLIAGGLIGVIYGGAPAGPHYDAMLHATLVGFVFAMIFGHAPIIFPAVLGLSVRYRPWLYLPLILLQVSLAGRVIADLAGWQEVRMWSGLLNALTILLYLVMIAPLWNRSAADK